MILLHRLKGEPVLVNADLIESVECAPDTIVTLVDGRRIVVTDHPDAVVERITRFRAAVIVAVEELRHAGPPARVLRAVPREDT